MTKRKHDPDILADQLDNALPPEKPDTKPVREDPLIEVAAKLATSEYPALTPEKMEQIEARVLDVHARLSARGRVMRLATVQRAFQLLIGMEILLFLAIFVTLIPEIGRSVPGDWLYGLNRAGERIEMALIGIVEDDAEVQSELAGRRIHEALILLGRGTVDLDLIGEAIDHLTQAAAASDEPTADMIQQARQINALLGSAGGLLSGDASLTTPETMQALSDATQAMQALNQRLLPPAPDQTP